MQCQRCGKELGNYTRCSFCGYDNKEGNVREMTNLEKNFYDGVTIDADENSEKNSSGGNFSGNKSEYRFSRRTIYISEESSFFSKIIDKLFGGLLNNSLISKIAVALIAIALSVLTLFVAVPIIFFILALGIALLAFSKLGR